MSVQGKPLVYVGTPYRIKPDYWVRVCRSMLEQVLEAGGFPLCTQTTYHGLDIEQYPDRRDAVLDLGKQFLTLAECALFHYALDISPGMRGEVEFCRAMGVPYLVLREHRNVVDEARMLIDIWGKAKFVPGRQPGAWWSLPKNGNILEAEWLGPAEENPYDPRRT